MTLILLPCTGRKRISSQDGPRARDLPQGSVDFVASEWGKMLASADLVAKPHNLYCGRAWREGAHIARDLAAEPVVISAGLGLIRRNQKIPTYSLTVARGKQDSIERQISIEKWSPDLWWHALGKHTAAQVSFIDLFRNHSPTLVLLVLSANYALMVRQELEMLEDQDVRKLRIFGAGIDKHLPSNVTENVMPYDRRFDGPESPSSGTMSDFGSRAMGHFGRCILDGTIEGNSVEDDKQALKEVMSNWTYSDLPKRNKLSDDEVLAFVFDNWDRTKGRSQATLRLLRDSGLACEQGRFKTLFHGVREKLRKSEASVT